MWFIADIYTGLYLVCLNKSVFLTLLHFRCWIFVGLISYDLSLTLLLLESFREKKFAPLLPLPTCCLEWFSSIKDSEKSLNTARSYLKVQSRFSSFLTYMSLLFLWCSIEPKKFWQSLCFNPLFQSYFLSFWFFFNSIFLWWLDSIALVNPDIFLSLSLPLPTPLFLRGSTCVLLWYGKILISFIWSSIILLLCVKYTCFHLKCCIAPQIWGMSFSFIHWGYIWSGHSRLITCTVYNKKYVSEVILILC